MRYIMKLNKKTVDDINVKGKKVLVRCDFNVPLKDGKITITNTLNTPDTGDMSNVGLWMSLFGASMAGTLGAAYVSLKKKKEEE